jgi:hypothetical protein
VLGSGLVGARQFRRSSLISTQYARRSLVVGEGSFSRPLEVAYFLEE